MPLPSRYPFNKYSCKQCGWSIVLVEKGDVLFGPRSCSQCGNDNIAIFKASPVEAAIKQPIEFIIFIGKNL